MNWFEELTGFTETTPDEVRSKLDTAGPWLSSKVNGRRYCFGELEVPTLADLRKRSRLPEKTGKNQLKVSEWIGDVQDLHVLPASASALFQAASQFNLLEMVHPGVSPEAGVAGYAHDHTQGPACAIACGAGTIYRNYFVHWKGQVGQTATHQVDCLAELATYFDNDNRQYWEMRNGYALVNEAGLAAISAHLQGLSVAKYEALKGLLRVGIQWDTEVTISSVNHRVTQVYCSALPVAYSQVAVEKWEPFARLILEATYEATMCAAYLNYQRTANAKVFLTLVGGGAFGNRAEWIKAAIVENLRNWRFAPLEVVFVSYGQSSALVQSIIEEASPE